MRLARALARLERIIGSDSIYTLRHNGPRDWEARTFEGDGGFGATLEEAIEDLCSKLR